MGYWAHIDMCKSELLAAKAPTAGPPSDRKEEFQWFSEGRAPTETTPTAENNTDLYDIIQDGLLEADDEGDMDEIQVLAFTKKVAKAPLGWSKAKGRTAGDDMRMAATIRGTGAKKPQKRKRGHNWVNGKKGDAAKKRRELKKAMEKKTAAAAARDEVPTSRQESSAETAARNHQVLAKDAAEEEQPDSPSPMTQDEPQPTKDQEPETPGRPTQEEEQASLALEPDQQEDELEEDEDEPEGDGPDGSTSIEQVD
jgi:hypothetical protein